MKKLSFVLLLIISLVACLVPASATSYDDEFVVEEQYSTELSGDEAVDQTPAESHAIYQSLYSLLHTHLYGGAELTPEMTLTLVQLSTFFTVVCVFIPFIPLLWLLKRWF